MKHIFFIKRNLILHLTLLVFALIVGSTTTTSAQPPNNSLDAADGIPSNAVYVDEDGNVGVGVSTPEARLHIQDSSIYFPPLYLSSGVSNELLLQNDTLGYRSSTTSLGFKATSQESPYVLGDVSHQFTGTASIDVHVDRDASSRHFSFDAESPNMPLIFKTEGVERMRITSDGSLGVGTGDPAEKLHVHNGALELSKTGSLPLILEQSRASVFTISNGGQESFTLTAGGNVGIGTASPLTKLDVAGRTRTTILEITGGSDLAEPFEFAAAESVKPGIVVAIDPDHPGQLRIAYTAYDRTVAGCVSGANGIHPGLTMQQEGTVEGEAFPVALSGRVYCWADASYGHIQPGDLLTTSDTSGHAMKVTDYNRAHGAIIGKAMSELAEGRDLILVLVSLQ